MFLPRIRINNATACAAEPRRDRRRVVESWHDSCLAVSARSALPRITSCPHGDARKKRKDTRDTTEPLSFAESKLRRRESIAIIDNPECFLITKRNTRRDAVERRVSRSRWNKGFSKRLAIRQYQGFPLKRGTLSKNDNAESNRGKTKKKLTTN